MLCASTRNDVRSRIAGETVSCSPRGTSPTSASKTDAVRDHRLIAEMLGWFDLVAVQEVADDLAGLYAVRELLPDSYRLLISDTAGNDERAAFVYDAARGRAPGTRRATLGSGQRPPPREAARRRARVSRL